jgi:hypothetical protein
MRGWIRAAAFFFDDGESDTSPSRHSVAQRLARRARPRQNPAFIFQRQFFLHARTATIDLPGAPPLQ